MEEKQSKNSWFVTPPGLLALFFFAVLSIYFKASVIGAFLLVFFLLCACSRAWSRGICRRVQVSVAPISKACHVGGQCLVEIKVRNHSLFPLIWLDVILPTGQKEYIRALNHTDSFHFMVKEQPEAQMGVRKRFLWLLWQQEIIWQEPLLATHRGIVPIEQLYLQAGDGFGLSATEERKKLAVPIRLILYPRLIPVSIHAFLRITEEAATSSRGQTEDITLLKYSRPYMAGDSARKINWRLLAGSGQLMVNVYESVLPVCTAFVLDLGSFRKKIKKENSQGQTYEETVPMEAELEAMISLIASCICELSHSHMPAALVLPAYRTQEAVFSLPEEGSPGVAKQLEALAMIDYQTEAVSFPCERFWRMAHRLGNIFLCTASDEYLSPDMTTLAETLGNSRLWILAGERTRPQSGSFRYLYAESICDCWNASQANTMKEDAI